MKVVLDTNVIISGLLWKGNAKVLFDLIEKNNITVCLTPQIIDEIKRVLSYPRIKKQLDNVGLNLEEIIFLLMQYSEVYPDIDMVNLVNDDPDDNKFLNCALVSDSQFIISGDRHLLKIKKIGNIPIITINKFLELF